MKLIGILVLFAFLAVDYWLLTISQLWAAPVVMFGSMAAIVFLDEKFDIV